MKMKVSVKETITNDGVIKTYHLDTNYGPLAVERTVLRNCMVREDVNQRKEWL